MESFLNRRKCIWSAGFWLFVSCRLSVSTGQSNLICWSQPIVALAGEDVTLPCRLDPPISATSRAVEWTRPGLDPEYVHVHQDGRLVYQSQNHQFKYRTALFVDQLVNGNVSLKLSRVKLSDAGRYRCFIPTLWKEAFIQVSVGAASSPATSLAGIDKFSSRVMLTCSSAGWYPEPEVLWLDGEGNLLSAGPTETVRGPDDLYTVSSRVTVEKRHSNSFTCRVQQKDTSQTREAHITVPEGVFVAPCEDFSSTHIAAFGLFVLVVTLPIWKWRKNIIGFFFRGWNKKKTTSFRNNSQKDAEKLDKMTQLVKEIKTEMETQRDRLTGKLEEVNKEREESKKKLQSVERKIKEKERIFDKPEELLKEKENLLKAQWKMDKTAKNTEGQILNLEKLMEPIEIQFTRTNTGEDCVRIWM